jgi:HEAT repeat protein
MALALLAGCNREPSVRGKKLSEWIEILKRSNDVSQLKESAVAFTELGPQAEPAAWELVRVLSDPQAFGHYRSLNEKQVADVYQAFAPALRAVGPAAGPIVVQAIEYKRPVSGQVMRALDPSALAIVLQALDHADARVRRVVAERWRDLGPDGKSGADALLRAIQQDKDNTVRIEATKSLGVIGADPKSTADALLSVLTDPLPLVRVAAAEGLANFPTESARLLQPLADRFRDEEPAVREAALQSLCVLAKNKQQAIPLLVSRITGQDANARQMALRAIVTLDGWKSLPHDVLISLITDETHAAQAAMTLLEQDPHALLFVPALVGQLRKRGDTATLARQKALAKVGAPAVPILIPMLKYNKGPAAESEVVRYEAAMGLSAIAGDAKSALPPLAESIETEPSEHVRIALIEATRQIKMNK